MQIKQIIKFISIILISGAIVLELLNIYIWLNNGYFLTIHKLIIWLAHIAIFSHFLEGIIAYFYIKFKHIPNRNPLQYGVYTFFTGTLSLSELFEVSGVRCKV